MQLFFLIKPGPYFILHPRNEISGGNHEHFRRKSFFLSLKKEYIYATLLQEVNFFQRNIDADCYFTAMLPRVLFFFVFCFLYNININNNSIVKKSWG